MKIKRSLKYGSFTWDESTKTFTIEYRGKSIELNKTYAFSFLRFAFSMASRNWYRKLQKPMKNSNNTQDKSKVKNDGQPELNMDLLHHKVEANSPFNDGYTREYHQQKVSDLENHNG